MTYDDVVRVANMMAYAEHVCPVPGLLLMAGILVADFVDVQYRECVRDEDRLRVKVEARKRAMLGPIRLDVDWQVFP
mgnify:CR=1 FL=1